jgi:1-hydroxycarotenoid 3,4-desaturase
MTGGRIVVIGAGIGGLACAIELAAQGCAVEVIERAACAGGKMREVGLGAAKIDAGPTVFTMRWVFDELFADAGASLADSVQLTPLDTLARHAWGATGHLDLFADIGRSADAIAGFAGPEEGRRFRAFCAEAATIYRTLREPFLTAQRPTPLSLARRIGFHRLADLFGIRPFETMWSALSKHFHDSRLRQLFGRYATYAGSSPFLAPATLMLIAHVEQDGVWIVRGGMQRLAEALERLARSLGVLFRFGDGVDRILVEQSSVVGVILESQVRIAADAVVVNADPAAVGAGLLGPDIAAVVQPRPKRERSLSALTWATTARTDGFSLHRHNVFFSGDYAAEFRSLFTDARMPDAPTVYVCAQDRDEAGNNAGKHRERLFLLINAPPIGDSCNFDVEEVQRCETRVLELLARCGLDLKPGWQPGVVTTPANFHRLFPGTGGALYGGATHGSMASFRRPAASAPIPGLYFAGGGTHPGAGVPMAALSGRLAARRLLADRVSIRSSRRKAISGGILTR